jgi:hypothetical protein
MKITKESVAAELNGIEYPCRIKKDLVEQAKAAGLVIVYGASDDLMEFEGAIYDELGCYEGGDAWIDSKGLLDRGQIDDDDEAIADFVARKKKAQKIQAIWSECGNDAAWTYRTDIPHATFDVMDEGDTYCRGIVFALADIAQEAI